ncbi:Gonadal protein gdl [Armadillidium nasatum]|uniref:Gonadal protein gdl n=1 Tax=Armadillidium nasatum TaxID=96803 RepID=A0A5N5SUY4_9CRUS|nr:Gonadal protein gdl [Armadillidium nasatum]
MENYFDTEQQMEKSHSQELANLDRRILEILDEKVNEQQSTLEQVGLPGFKVTNNATEVKVQMYIIGFILKLGNINTRL